MRKLKQYYRRFTGQDLPAREMILKLPTPAQTAKNKAPKASELILPKLPNHSPEPLEELRLAVSFLRRQNQARMASLRRFAWAERIMRRFCPLALELVRKNAHDGAVPDSQERQQALEVSAELLRRLLDAYRIIFKDWYGAGNFRFARVRKKFETCAWRLIDLSHFWQRALGLRYRVLPDAAWLAINQAYFAMRELGQAENELYGIEDIYAEERKPRTLQHQYLVLQMIARLDILRWPTEWHFTLDGYGRIAHALIKLEEDGGNIVRPDYALAFSYDAGPARAFRPPGAALGKSVLLNWKNLRMKLQRDYQRNLEFQTKAIDQRAFAMLSFNDGLALLELQKRCWDALPLPLPERDARAEQCDLRIFVGFKGIYPFLYSLHYGTGPTEQVGERMVDLLAQRSALFAEDHTATTDSIWLMLEQNAQRLTLRTQETAWTTQMRIGSLAAYGLGAQGLLSSALGNISRIYRPHLTDGQAAQVVVEIEKMSAFSEPVLLHSEMRMYETFQDKAEGLQYALLALQEAGAASTVGAAQGANLMLPAHAPMVEGAQVVMKRVGRVQKVRIGALLRAAKTWRCHSYEVLA
ncbi:hypothetical protein V8J88_09410 [Massilia sp. W12]|uniref:hypothetical protein n=1 Tax=Massilia sp. W12 TaxID=3126507 RepID=UPI0030CD814B